MTDLGVRAEAVGQAVVDAMAQVHQQWALLDAAFTLVPKTHIAETMNKPLESARDFAEVMTSAKKVLSDSTTEVFPSLAVTRQELLGRIENLNGRHLTHSQSMERELAAFRADTDNDPVLTGKNHPDTRDYAAAKMNLDLLDQEAEVLAIDVETFNRDVAEAEQGVADQLRALTGGDDVTRIDGTFVNTVQRRWGLTLPGTYQGPGATREDVDLAVYFDHRITVNAVSRIEWFSTATTDQVEDWLGAHPEFFALVGFVPPTKAAALFDRLSARSTADASGTWVTGPLAALYAVAPAAVGNLNGVSAQERARFNDREVDRLLSQPDLTEDQRRKLGIIDVELKKGLNALSVFLDDTGEVRASFFVGDPDSADQIITVTHGIATDTGALGEWGTIMKDAARLADKQLEARKISSTTAVVLFMEWDSGEVDTVLGDDKPEAGATRLGSLIDGLRHLNPDAWQEGWAHSLGTTTVAIAQTRLPGLFDHATFFGSAGLTGESVLAMESQVNRGDFTVSATSAELDWIAIHGRAWVHPHDPGVLGFVEKLGSDGGVVTDYITDSGKPPLGLPTQGHNAGASTDPLYRVHRRDPWELLTFPEESVGYMDPRAQSFLQAVAEFAERVEERQ
jgi:hypothetical protein